MGKILVIKGADFSQVAVGKVDLIDPTGAPVISITPAGGVTISCEGAVAIYYTTNGSTPTTGSTKYTTTFNVSSGTTVKAIAEFASGSTSGVASKTYSSGGAGWIFGYSDADYANCQQKLKNMETFSYWSLAEEPNNKLLGKTISKIKVLCHKEGKLYIYSVSGRKASESTKTTLAEITFDKNDIEKVVEKDIDFSIPNSGYVAVAISLDGVTMYNTNAEGTTKMPFYGPTGSSYTTRDLCIDFMS